MAAVKTICLEALERRCAAGETGRLDFHRGEHEGQIFTQNRYLIHAQLAGLEGIPALFRLFDWGDADVTWNPGIEADLATLHITMDQAGVLYAENLRQREELEAQERERFDQAFATASLAGASDSVLKHYTMLMEAVDSSMLPGGFTFADETKNSYVIGSSDDCDVVLRHPSVDPLHCGLILENGSVYVWDLGSQSGIQLNSTPISEGKLKVGDVMTLGTIELRVRFQLRRPKFNRPKTMPLPTVTAPHNGPPPSSEMPKGPITFEKVSRQLKSSGKGQPFLTKLGSLFGPKGPKAP